MIETYITRESLYLACVNRMVDDLDTLIPGWREDINLNILDMIDARVCVLGQLSCHNPEHAEFFYERLAEGESWGVDIFEVYLGGAVEDWQTLTQMWTREILEETS